MALPADLAKAPASRAALARRRLADEVRDLVAREFVLSGAVPPGGLLPSETELAERYGVSRVTVRAGMRSLQEAGLLLIRQGIGSTVLPRPRAVMQGLDRLCSLETFAREAGQTVESEAVEVNELAADVKLADRLGVERGHAVLVVRRVKLLGGARVGWMLDYLPAGVVPFDLVREEPAGSVLDLLLTHARPPVDYADTEIFPVSLPAGIARRLGVKSGTAALHVDALAHAADGRVLEWAQSWLLPAPFRFSVRRRRPIGA